MRSSFDGDGTGGAFAVVSSLALDVVHQDDAAACSCSYAWCELDA